MVGTNHDALAATLLLFEKGNHQGWEVRLAHEMAVRFVEDARLFIFQVAEVAEENALGKFLEDGDLIILERTAERTRAERQANVL